MEENAAQHDALPIYTLEVVQSRCRRSMLTSGSETERHGAITKEAETQSQKWCELSTVDFGNSITVIVCYYIGDGLESRLAKVWTGGVQGSAKPEKRPILG